jgi:hypothetical protein
MLDVTRPYHRITFEFLVRELLMPREDVEALLIEMILDERISAEIDQINGHIYLNKSVTNKFEKKEIIEISRIADVISSSSNSLCLSSI